MVETKTKIKIRTKARLLRGLTNILNDDIERIYKDAEDYDVIRLQESLQDASDTLQCLLDNVVELDYELYLSKRGTRD